MVDPTDGSLQNWIVVSIVHLLFGPSPKNQVFYTPSITAMDSSETDHVFPIHAFDDSGLNRSMVVTGLLRYSSLLDANKLRDSLVTLLHTGDWKKLRGRLRFDASSSLMICSRF